MWLGSGTKLRPDELFLTDKYGRGTFLDWIYGFLPIPKTKTKRGILRYPASVLAPESALGSRPRVALSSAQAIASLIPLGNVALIYTATKE